MKRCWICSKPLTEDDFESGVAEVWNDRWECTVHTDIEEDWEFGDLDNDAPHDLHDYP